MNANETERAWRLAWDRLETCYDRCRRTIFEPRARDLVGRAGIDGGTRVLDLGTGTGLAAFASLERVGRGGLVVGADSSRGLLRGARREAARQGAHNLEFVRTSMTRLALPDAAFDHVIGNFSLCCSPSYPTTLEEAYRVLRPGGILTYNHEGPHLHPVASVYKEVLERHRLQKPPADLRRIREASALVDAGWSQYKDPFVALQAVETVGFREATATLSLEHHRFPSLEDYLDYKVTGSSEFAALPPERQESFLQALREALRPHLSDSGLLLRQEVLTLQGRK